MTEYTIRQTRPDGNIVHYAKLTPLGYVFTSEAEEAVILESKEEAEELRELIENDTKDDLELWVGDFLFWVDELEQIEQAMEQAGVDEKELSQKEPNKWT